MKIVFWGTMFDPNDSKELLLKSKVGLQNAANTYQWGFIQGLLDNGFHDIEIISALPVGSYPQSNKKLVYRSRHYKKDGLQYYQPGFLNFYILRELIRTYSFESQTKKIIDKTHEKVVVFVYSLYLPFLTAINRLQLHYKDKVHFCLIVPDLPGKYGIMRSNFTAAGIWDRITVNKTLKLAKFADSYVLLSLQMKDALKIEKSFCVIEGFVSTEKKVETDAFPNDKNKIILYTGSFNPEYGILNLLNSFTEMDDPDFRLWLCGPPNEAATILDAAKKDNRIKYWGYLTKQEVFELQEQCDVLVNPRQNNREYVKYSFPSKTMEYVASAKPIVMYRLDGIPVEYDAYLNYVDTSLKDKIVEVLSKPKEELEIEGDKGRAWILKEKNGKKQLEKVLQMIETENF